MKIFYKTSATATGGRDGRTQVDDGSIGFDLVSFQNESGKHGTNPEQLFAMGYAACFDSAMNHVAPTLGLKPTTSSTTVGVGIGQKPDGAFGLDFDIPSLSLACLKKTHASSSPARTKSAHTPTPRAAMWMCACM